MIKCVKRFFEIKIYNSCKQTLVHVSELVVAGLEHACNSRMDISETRMSTENSLLLFHKETEMGILMEFSEFSHFAMGKIQNTGNFMPPL